MERMVDLSTPGDVNCVAFGGEMYEVKDGRIRVPESCARQLLKSHRGYAEIRHEARPANVATIKRKA